jgi:hypothetical protein
MAKCDTPFLLQEPRDQAFERVLDSAGKLGWRVTKTTPPNRFYRLTPELNLKAGRKQLDGCGTTRIQFYRCAANRTRVRVYTRWALTESRAEAPAISLLKGLSHDPKQHNLDPEAAPLPGRGERKLIRFLVAAIVIATVLAVILVPVPEDSEGNPDLPAVALHDERLFYGEVAFLVFYGSLLLLTPAFAGVFRGRLPTEISTRGAKYEEEVKQERAETSDKVTEEQTRERLKITDELTLAKGAIENLAKDVASLKRQN